MARVRNLFAAGASLLAVAGLGYTAFAIARVRAFRKKLQSTERGLQPAITIFKPLYGDEPLLYENLRSFCEQIYPQYQVLFGARNSQDPALGVARRLVRDFPQVDLEVIVTGGHAWPPNPKIANVLGMLPHAKHDVFVIADSDIRVGPGYLAAIAAAFANDNTGAVTCLYGGTPVGGAASQLGALFANDRFAPSVLVALALEPLSYCFGATMAVRRNTLQRIGGLEAVAGNLGDDYLLGKLVTDAGLDVVLCPYIVQTTVSDPDFASVWRHQLRWQRTIRASRPAGFAGSLVTYGLPLACIASMAVASPMASGALLSAAVTVRYILHSEARSTFAPHVDPAPWLVAAADFLSLGTWLASFFVDDVSWRGSDFAVGDHGALS